MPLTPLRLAAQSADRGEMSDEKVPPIERIGPDELTALPGFDFSGQLAAKRQGVAMRPAVGSDLGLESEPNDTAATADPLGAAEGRIRGNLLTQLAPITTDASDVDMYSFTTSVANSKVYASTMTSFGNGTDTTLDVIASDGTTVLETDLADGTFAASAGSIAGTNLATPGTYYLRVTSGSVSTPVAPYFLYFAVKSATPTAEVEPNNTTNTPNPLPVSGLMSGVVNPAADNDTFSFAANAGDTVFISLDTDPERDNVQWNGRMGLGLFGTPQNFLVVNDTSVGSATNPLSEAFFMTVKASGTYIVYVDEPAGGGAATDTYVANVTVIPGASSCSTFTNSTPTPLTDLGLTSSTINVPTSGIISKVKVSANISHPLTADLDVHLVSPANNDNGIFTDITTTATQTVQINTTLDDNAGIPIGGFGVNSDMIYQPETSYRLSWYNGEDQQGNWRLDIRDDLTANTGTLNSWSLEICTDSSVPSGNVVYSTDFEASDGGFTHSGTLDEWERGTPATAAASGVAPFTNCASGTNCWKTDLDNTYENSSIQDLVSPNINLMGVSGPITLSWNSRYSIENVSFDRAWVRVAEVGNPSNFRIVWHNDNPTMTDSVGNPSVSIGESAGWARYTADISDFVNKTVQVTFHLDTDTSVVLAGWAVDDVAVRATISAVPVNISGRVVSTSGRPIVHALVTMTLPGGTMRTATTNLFGFFTFDNVLTGQTVTIVPARKGYAFTPQMVTVNMATTVNFVGTGSP